MMKVKSKTSKKRQQEEISSGRSGGEGPVLRAAKRFALPLLVFCWPMLYLFRQIFILNGYYIAIINDFILLYYKYKVYLLDCLANSHFPLWSPSESAGFPFYTNPFAQVFYPFNALLLLWYKAFGGYSPLDHQLFTVLGISIFALGLFMWLKLINKDIKSVVFAVLVMSVSFKVTEIIRFPNAVHSMAWYPWILYALTRVMFSDSVKETAKSAGLLVLFGVFLCTAGYPYFVYYTIFLVLPYLLAFLITPLRTRLFGERPVCLKRAFAAMLAAGFATLLLCAPHLIGIKRLMSQTIDRAGKDFEYSTSHIFNFTDTIGSLVYPPASSTEGWYFFSITALLIIAIYLFSRRRPIVGKETQEAIPVDTGSLWVKLFFVVWFGLITYISYGRSSYLFVLLWKYMPGFSSLRVWGRLNIILVPILAWLLSVAFSHFVVMLRNNTGGGLRRVASKPVLLTAVYAVVLSVQLYLHLKGVRNQMWLLYFKAFTANEAWFIFFGVVAFVAILLIMILGTKIRLGRGWLTAVTVLLILVATVEMWHTGARMWSNHIKATPQRFKLDVAKIDEMSFNYPRTDITNTMTLSPRFNVGVVVNWYFARYISFLTSTAGQEQARNILLGVRDGQKIFFSESIEHPSIEAFLRDALRYRQTGRMISYNGDELRWEIDSPVTGYLSFIDNWDPDWKAYVDGQPTQIGILFGTFKSVRLTQGKHNVRFCYQPGLFPAVSEKAEKTAPDPVLKKNSP
ncbi:MAG: hypothetical protein ABSB25_06810 [Sedimentisphaerales bacterium]|jgi:hypothetical protein